WAQEPGRVLRRVQVMVQHPAERSMLCSAVARVGLLPGVGTQQFVEGEPSGYLLGGQVRSRQLFKAPASLAGCDPSQAGGGGHGDVRSRVQAKKPEHPRGWLAEVA